MTTDRTSDAQGWPMAGDSEAARLIRTHDWTTTPLGRPGNWSQSLRATIDLMLGSRHAMCLSWGDGLTLLYNDAYAPFLGLRHPTAMGQPMADVWTDVWPEIAPLVDRALSGEAVWFEDFHLVMERNGYAEDTWWNFSYSPARDDGGVIVGMLNVASDATAAVLARREAAAERERQQRMLQQMPGFVAQLSGPDHRFTYVNDAYVAISGERDFIGRTVREVFPELAGQGYYELLDQVYATGERFAARALPIMLEQEAAPRYIDLLYQPVRDDMGKVAGIFVGGYDITDRVRAEAERRDSEARYRSLFDAIDSGFCIIEMKFDADRRPVDYRIVEANHAFAKQTGLGDAVGKWVSETVPDLEPHWFEIYGRVALTGEAVQFENEAAPFGRWYDVHAYRTGAPDQHRVAILFNDITDRRRADIALREWNETLESRVEERTAERNLLARIVETTDVMVLVSDLDYNILAINRANTDAFERIYGVRPRVGDNMLDLLADQPEQQAGIRAVWGRGLAGEEITLLERHGNPDSWYEIQFRTLRNDRGERIGAYQFVTDVTQRIRDQQRLNEAEEALRQSQKMESMGQLTGGVAHDFNNLLTPIVGSLDMLLRRGVGSERERRLIDGALQSAERARTLVQRLLAFARRQPLQPVPVDIAVVIEGMKGLIESTVGPTIVIRLALEPHLPPARADANQLEMALLNLAVNARDAMPGGGMLMIAASHDRINKDRPAGLQQGDYIRLSVADTGMGMDSDTLARAIEPFFSTKGIGKGTGLGLSMVHGLAAQLGGDLHIDSTPGKGTEIALWLPVSGAAIDVEPEPQPVVATGRSRGHALLVDDEPLVRLSIAHMLGDLGFSVTEVASGTEAMALLDDGLAPDLLVTDHLMPGMTGVELARMARGRQPDLPVLIVSGYADMNGIAPDLPRLVKPFLQAELAAMIEGLRIV